VARTIALVSGALLALALLALPCFVALHRRDAAAPDDGDLRIAAAPTDSAGNGFVQFAAAAATAQLPKGVDAWKRFHAFRAGEDADRDWISDLVARNAPAIELVREGIAAPACALPLPDRANDARVQTMFRLQQVVALAGAQARLLLGEGRAPEAIELASLGLRVGKRVSAADNLDLFGIYRANAYLTVSLLDLEHAVRAARVTPEASRELARVLEATRWRASDWQRAFASEYGQLAAAFAGVESAPVGWPLTWLPPAYRWQPYRTVAMLADSVRHQLRKSAQFCADAGLVRGSAPPLPYSTLFAPNAVGRIVIEQIESRNFDEIQLTRCQLETHVSLVEVLAAVKAYSDARGRLPDRLEELVPDYLDALPLDRYDGAPLRYAPSERAVYSVGDDFVAARATAAPSALDNREPGLSLAF
jgi:hypothetical protein